MSRSVRLAIRLVTALLLATAGISAHAAGPEPAAEVVSLQGKGEFRDAAETRWRDATVRQKLAQGNFVRTGDVSRMGVLLADQTQVRLAPNSMIQIKQVGDGRDRGTVLNQSAGRSWSQSKNVPRTLTIETPSALAAIRGTDWELVVDEEGTTTLTVLSGEVLLSNAQGSVNIGAGEQARAQKGVAPVKRVLANPRERVQWVSSFTVDASRYPELSASAVVPPGSQAAALKAIGELLRAGEFSAARVAVEKLIALPQDSGTARLLRADFQAMQGEFEAAITGLREGALLYPRDERFDVWRTRLHLARDELPDARDALASARARNPRSTETLLAEGELERFEGNARAASTAYRAALELAPAPSATARAWHGLGIVQSEREDVANARSSLTQALTLDPRGAGFRAELGTLEAFANDLAGARAQFLQALDEQADDYIALTGLGLVELKAGNTDIALDRLLAATLIEPRYARAQTYLAVAYYQLGRIPDALFALKRTRELDPKDPLPDLFESVIHNDLLKPGDALASARRALALLPYLKSLNQIANDQKGGANLGSALAAFGLEDWARSYAQDSYTPFWGGSHLFLADRYAGDFNKKSELFQGFLSDPTVFGASNRFATLIPRPGTYFNLGSRYNSSRDFRLSEPTITLNGYANNGIPVAYFLEGIRTETRPDRVAFDAAANTYTLALGARPSHELGLFAYANAFDADIRLQPSSAVEQRVKGRNERYDLGANYRFGPQAQAWLKLGSSNESSTVNQLTSIALAPGIATNASEFRTRPAQRDLQFRHTFVANERHELSWGVELGSADKTNSLVQENFFKLGAGIVPSDRLDQHDQDRSRDIWVSDRFRANDHLTVQGDLALQNYTKTREISIFRDRVPPAVQRFPERYERPISAPRLGAAYVLGGGATLRAAYQKWLRPASYNTLTPVATAGIPVDDTLVNAGGILSRTRAQLDWEVSPAWFVNAFVDRRSVDNLSSPLDGVLNTRADVANLDRLRQKSVVNLAAPDQLEATPVFSRGVASSGGFVANHVLSRSFAGYFGYAYTRSENTSNAFRGNSIPYLARNRTTVGLTWASDLRMLVSAQAVWRSARFADEANLTPLPAGWDMTLKLRWESSDKRWNVDAYAANLLKKSAGNLVGVNLVARF